MKSLIFGSEALPPGAKRAILAGFIGFAVDFFDIYLPAIVLTPVMGFFEPGGLSPATTTTIYYFTIAATLLGRPCGAVIFGHWADRIGRRRTTVVSIAGFGTLTGLIACIPGYASVGLWSLGLLLAIRFISGVFMGGEYTSNNTLALEMVSKERRGFVGGLLQGALPVGFAAVSLVTTIMLALTTKQQYFDWGWRIPFLLGCGFAFVFLAYYRTVPESTMWQEAEKSDAPLRELLSGANLRSLGQVFVMMSGFWLVVQPSTALPSLMVQHLHVSGEMTSKCFFFASIALFFALVGWGLLGQRIGRRRTIIIAGLVELTVCPLIYYAMISHVEAGGSVVVTAVLAGVFQAMVVSPWGVATTYICERFPTRVRASGYGIGYSIAVVIPSFSGIYLLWLGKVMPYLLGPIVLLVIAALLMIVGSSLGPETREVELHLPDLGRARSPPPAGKLRSA